MTFVLHIVHEGQQHLIYVAFMWNWPKSSLCDYVIFITSCINHALVDEICWPSSFAIA
jgi:hypothetical protein